MPDARRACQHGTLRAIVVFRHVAKRINADTAQQVDADIVELSAACMGQQRQPRKKSLPRPPGCRDCRATRSTARTERQPYDQAFTLQVHAADRGRLATPFPRRDNAPPSRPPCRSTRYSSAYKQNGEDRERSRGPERDRWAVPAGRQSLRLQRSSLCRADAESELRARSRAGRDEKASSEHESDPLANQSAGNIERLRENHTRPRRSVAQVGTLRQRALLGQRARGLQPRRLRLGISHPRHGAQQSLSLG